MLQDPTVTTTATLRVMVRLEMQARELQVSILHHDHAVLVRA